MYPVRLIAIGRPRLAPVRELEQHYLDLLKAFVRLAVVELPEGRGDAARQLREEAERMRPQLLAARCPVLLCADGPVRSSEAFAQWLGARMDRGESLAFAVGSSHGFDPALKVEVREHLSLGPMTFPHDLSRVLFLEQLYRACSILKGTPYHK
jgi:23S rRNA (pseudouridine1915-N3)-methyltransferase